MSRFLDRWNLDMADHHQSPARISDIMTTEQQSQHSQQHPAGEHTSYSRERPHSSSTSGNVFDGASSAVDVPMESMSPAMVQEVLTRTSQAISNIDRPHRVSSSTNGSVFEGASSAVGVPMESMSPAIDMPMDSMSPTMVLEVLSRTSRAISSIDTLLKN